MKAAGTHAKHVSRPQEQVKTTASGTHAKHVSPRQRSQNESRPQGPLKTRPSNPKTTLGAKATTQKMKKNERPAEHPSQLAQ